MRGLDVIGPNALGLVLVAGLEPVEIVMNGAALLVEEVRLLPDEVLTVSLVFVVGDKFIFRKMLQ